MIASLIWLLVVTLQLHVQHGPSFLLLKNFNQLWNKEETILVVLLHVFLRMGAAFCSQMFAVAPYTHCKHQFATAGLLGASWAQQTMDQAKDLEMETNPTENETFEELVTELGGFGKYQKRLLCLLAAFLFTTIPLLQCHQVAKRLSRKIKN